MAVTRADVARAAGVSPAVVSYVVNQGPRGVSRSARQRVEEAVLRLGYRPNAVATALRGGSTRSIGFLSSHPRNSFYAEVAESLERELYRHGYIVVAAHAYGDRDREVQYLRTFVDRKVDAIVVAAGISLSDEDLAQLEQPILVLEDAHRSVGASTISTEDSVDAARAVEHLQRHGHTRIGCITTPPHVTTASARITGWRSQQRRAGNPAGEEYLAYADLSQEGGYAAAHLLLAPHGRVVALNGQPPTAIFVGSDDQAAGVLYACHELRLDVPSHVALVSMGGTRAASFTIPALTTMRQDIELIARTTTAALLSRIGHAREPEHLSLQGNLVIAGSCGC